MPRKPKAIPKLDEDKLDGFAHQVEQALEHYAEPEWLGANSLLAAPFVFGQMTDASNRGETTSGRGVALQEALESAAQRLNPELHLFIIDLYLQRKRNFTNVARAMKQSLSERTFYRRRHQAIQALAAILYETLLPPLRTEQPLVRPMAGRVATLQACLNALHTGQSTHLSGPSGVGKTVLGGHIVEQWPVSSFWFTVRARLTDRLASFVFAFAHYLRSQGATATWRQLIADTGLVQVDRALSLLRYDLAQLQETEGTPLLLCVDDVDTLAPERADHTQLLHLLHALQPQVRLLLLGQRVVLETDVHYVLTGFDDTELQAWLALTGITGMAAKERQQLRQATNGHPTLLGLLVALHGEGEDLLTAAASLADTPSVEVLLARVWRRLDDRERQVLMEVALFRTAAPLDAWRHQAGVIDRLLTRGLILADGRGGVECDRHIHTLVYERIPADVRRVLHLRTASVLEEHGEFIQAIYHYIEGHQPAQAVWLWFRHRTQQVERGQGPAALALLDQIVPADLADAHDQAALALARAELLQLVGRSEATGEALAGLHLSRGSSTLSYAQQLLANALEKQNDVERSLATYRNALETLTGSVQLRQVVLYQKLSYLHITRLPDLAAAQREAMQALFHAETFAANVEELKGDLTAARVRYTRALEIAEQVDNNTGLLSIAYSHFGKLLLKVGELDAAVTIIQQALTLCELRGDVLGPLYDRINLAYALTVQGRSSDALALAVDGLSKADRMQHGYLIAGLAAAAGDAARHQQELEAAEHYAHRSLIQEEEFFRPWALTVLGLAQAGRGRISQAMTTLQMAVEAASVQEDGYGEAYAWEALGKVCWQNAQQGEAMTRLKQAHEFYRVNGFLFEANRLHADMLALGIASMSVDESGIALDARNAT